LRILIKNKWARPDFRFKNFKVRTGDLLHFEHRQGNVTTFRTLTRFARQGDVIATRLRAHRKPKQSYIYKFFPENFRKITLKTYKDFLIILFMKFYIDTCIWRDYYENRFSDKPIGRYALRFFNKIIKEKHSIIFTNLIINELKIAMQTEEIENLFKFFYALGILFFVQIEGEIYYEAKQIATTFKIPLSDAIRALVAKKNDAIIITRDKHFNIMINLVECKTPEDFISNPSP
jgi:predicted nucleic acid-binding protein